MAHNSRRRRPLHSVVVLCGVTAVAALACGDKDPPVRPTPARECGLPLDSLIANPASITVRMVNFEFQPDTVRPSRGGTVTWVNCGNEPHSATSDDGVWDSGIRQPNDRFTHTFAEAGDFPYFCIPHPTFMRGAVIVP
jgi:plastocyanin